MITKPCGMGHLFHAHPVPQPFQGWNHQSRFPRVARSSQPWALLRNPFGIQRLRRKGAGAVVYSSFKR